VKRLREWDAVLLYSETQNVPMHTLKLTVIQLDDLGGAKFGVEELRKVIHSRLYKLDPFRYELIARWSTPSSRSVVRQGFPRS